MGQQSHDNSQDQTENGPVRTKDSCITPNSPSQPCDVCETTFCLHNLRAKKSLILKTKLTQNDMNSNFSVHYNHTCRSSHSFSYLLTTVAFVVQWQSWVV